ncbi:hypothetical protein [Enterococcus sp. AZ163]
MSANKILVDSPSFKALSSRSILFAWLLILVHPLAQAKLLLVFTK